MTGAVDEYLRLLTAGVDDAVLVTLLELMTDDERREALFRLLEDDRRFACRRWRPIACASAASAPRPSSIQGRVPTSLSNSPLADRSARAIGAPAHYPRHPGTYLFIPPGVPHNIATPATSRQE
jgi:hypothetical protein